MEGLEKRRGELQRYGLKEGVAVAISFRDGCPECEDTCHVLSVHRLITLISPTLVSYTLMVIV